MRGRACVCARRSRSVDLCLGVLVCQLDWQVLIATAEDLRALFDADIQIVDRMLQAIDRLNTKHHRGTYSVWELALLIVVCAFVALPVCILLLL